MGKRDKNEIISIEKLGKTEEHEQEFFMGKNQVIGLAAIKKVREECTQKFQEQEKEIKELRKIIDFNLQGEIDAAHEDLSNYRKWLQEITECVMGVKGALQVKEGNKIESTERGMFWNQAQIQTNRKAIIAFLKGAIGGNLDPGFLKEILSMVQSPLNRDEGSPFLLTSEVIKRISDILLETNCDVDGDLDPHPSDGDLLHAIKIYLKELKEREAS